MENSKKEILLEVKNLKKYFEMKSGFFNKSPNYVKAVDNLNFDIYKGETLGLVGESGCGKSTVGRTIIKLYEPTEGQILFDGKDISNISDKEMFPYRKKMQMIFQDPYSSLNGRMTVSDIISEPIEVHNLAKGKEKNDMVHELLRKVGLKKDHASRYPHEFSGGQRQRVGIARALAVEPDFIICDEPISALDVSIQAQIVNMLEDLQRDMGLTYLFIAHDLSMVRHISDRICVMYLGKFVEIAESDDLYENAKHPYSQALLSAIPIPDPRLMKTMDRTILEGDVPSPLNPPSGCTFRTRCEHVMPVCSEIEPILRDVDGHQVACHLYK